MNKPFTPSFFRSYALWPEEAKLCCENPTKDDHASRQSAEGVCSLLLQNGFGGNRQIFPVKVWVEEFTEEDLENEIFNKNISDIEYAALRGRHFHTKALVQGLDRATEVAEKFNYVIRNTAGYMDYIKEITSFDLSKEYAGPRGGTAKNSKQKNKKKASRRARKRNRN